MKLLILHREIGYFYGGAEKHIKESAERLASLGHEIIILTEKGIDDPLNELKKMKEVKVVYLPSIKIRRTDQFKRISKDFSNRIKKSVFLTKFSRISSNFVWMAKSSFWVLKNRKNFEVCWVSKYVDTKSLQILNCFKKIPYVVSLEGYDWIEAENSKKSKYVFTISDFILKKCTKVHKFNPEKITIGCDFKKFNSFSKKELKKVKSFYSSGNEILVLNVGRLVDSKDMKTFIQSSQIVSKKYSSVKFIICGSGPEKENLENLIHDLDLINKVYLVENLSDDQLIKHYKSADIFVHVPKEGNHFGVVYIEAMAAGLPIIATNEEATPDTVGNSALIINKESPKEMSKAILKLLKDKNLRKTLSKEGISRAKKEFNWDLIIPKMEKIFERAIKD